MSANAAVSFAIGAVGVAMLALGSYGVARLASSGSSAEPVIIDAQPIREKLGVLGLEVLSDISPSYFARGYCPTETTGAETTVKNGGAYARVYLCVWPNGRFTVVW